MKLLYIANIRLPTEKAHGLQIMQNCEAFAETGASVSLWVARRVNTPELRGRDPYAHYGVERIFSLRRLPCLDLLPLAGEHVRLGKLAFGVQALTFTLVALVMALFTHADVYYSRDTLVLVALSLIKPKQSLAYEAHSSAKGRIGRWLQGYVISRCAVVATTRRLADDLIAHGADPARTLAAHDGIRRARFEHLPTKAEARVQLGWDQDVFVVGYVGRLHTMTMEKGVGILIDALAQLGDASIALVGGPDEMAAEYRARWLALGLPPEHFLYAGQIAPEAVPAHIAAFDVCAMPLPFTEHFAYYASPIKLFEYMVSARAIVASDLPSTAEVVRNGETALLVPPSDVNALATALRRLHDDAALRQRLGEAAREEALAHYTWHARAETILDLLNRQEASSKFKDKSSK